FEGVDEGERARGAAEECRARVVANAAEHVRVHVDRPGQHQAAGRVDHLGAAALDPAHAGDQAVLDQHVRRRGGPGRDDVAADDRDARAHAHDAGATSASVGAARSSRGVYSCCGCSSTVTTGPDSTSEPCSITSTVSATQATTPRLWVM